MFNVALFTIAKTWKQPKYPSSERERKMRWCIVTVEYYSALKKNEVIPLAPTWMVLELIVLSKPDKYHMISFICGI